METSWLPRVIGVIIAGAAIAAAGLLWVTLVVREVEMPIPAAKEAVLWSWDLLYAQARPPTQVVWVAVAVAILAASSVSALELWAARGASRSTDSRTTPLSPSVRPRRTGRRTDGTSGASDTVGVTVLMPAHDEEAILQATLRSLRAQSRRPDRIIVIADNCTDGTVKIALENSVEVIETVGNTRKKAGALNQVLDQLLPGRDDDDLIMVMDADTSLAPDFIATALHRFEVDESLIAVGGIFYGEEGHGLLGQFQRSEYFRYARQIGRRRGRVFVLTGTSSIFRPRGMRTVAESRGSLIPGPPGEVYDTVALTEDNELTIALKSLGATMVSPAACSVVTEVMSDWSALWRQRMRWQRGAVENLGTYGITTATARYWTQQVAIGYGTISLYAFMLMMGLMLLSVDSWVWFPFWVLIGLVFVLQRVVSVWRAGWRARILAALLLPELCYDVFLNAVFVRGLFDITVGRAARWGHVHRPEEQPVESGPS